jgi:hypothetical protein
VLTFGDSGYALYSDDVPDLSNNVRVDYSIFGTTYTI